MSDQNTENICVKICLPCLVPYYICEKYGSYLCFPIIFPIIACEKYCPLICLNICCCCGCCENANTPINANNEDTDIEDAVEDTDIEYTNIEETKDERELTDITIIER